MRWIAGCLAMAAVLGLGARAEASTIKLAPHKAVYDLSLISSQGPRGIEAARGRIAFDFTGDACEGYALSFRQVTVLESGEGGARTSDIRTTTFEEGEGAAFKFRSETVTEGEPTRIIDGDADRSDSTLIVRVNRPKRERLDVKEGVIFPTAHMKKLIVAAEAGERIVAVKVFDGSDDGRRVYDTLSVIGKRIEPGNSAALEDAAKTPGLDRLPRWPVTISYFTPGEGERTPIYTISFDLYENGVSRALKLDYGDFSLKGDLKQVDLLPASACAR
jgi:hypothetical protein